MAVGMSAEYHEAVRRSRLRKKFRVHLMFYIIVNLVLLSINLIWWKGYAWIVWPLIGWGVALLYHAVSAFMPGNRITEHRIREIMKTLKK